MWSEELLVSSTGVSSKMRLLSIFTLIHCGTFICNAEVSDALAEIVKETLSESKEELRGILLEKFRIKRLSNPGNYDVKLEDSNDNFLEAKLETTQVYPFVCNGKSLIMQNDGIYKVDGFMSDQPLLIGKKPELTKIQGDWKIGSDKVLHVKEWEQKCFVVVSNHNGSFSSIYTLHGDELTPIFRQKIRNFGTAIAAQFFTLKKKLYLIIANDNAVNSLTVCPVFRWAGTYMDQIHSIMTRGAAAVVTFTVSSWEYIAIAQSMDSDGNAEIGTQILRMGTKEQLEKVQLLWSNNPVSLQYVSSLEQNYIIVGQAKEPSIVYEFQGGDFVQVQTLDYYFGPKLFMDYFTLSKSDEIPVFLAAKPSSIDFYPWSPMTGSFVPNNISALTIKPPVQIISAKFLRPQASQVLLAIVLNDRNRPILRIYPVSSIKIEIAQSQVKETERELAQCLADIRQKLDGDEKLLPALEEAKNVVLTVYGNLNFNGTVIVNDEVRVNSVLGVSNLVEVLSDRYVTTPNTVLEKLSTLQRNLKINVLENLSNLLMSDRSGIISGAVTFYEIEVKELLAPTASLQLDFLNGVSMENILTYGLKKNSELEQEISGTWILKTLSATEIIVPSQISGVEVSNLLLKQCSQASNQLQIMTGNITFISDIKFPSGMIMNPDVTVNEVKLSDVVLKNGPIREIRGFKHATNVDGGEGFVFSYLNAKNFIDWYNSVLHIQDVLQESTGLKMFYSSKAVRIENLRVETVNEWDWSNFYSYTLKSFGDQDIFGDVQFNKLEVTHLEANSIASFEFDSILTTKVKSRVLSNITVTTLTTQKNFEVELLNQIPLIALAIRKNEDATINGPVLLENVKIQGDVTLEELITIEGKDVSEIAKLPRKQTYWIPKNRTINLTGAVEAENLKIDFLNGVKWDDLEISFWDSSKDNNVLRALDFRGRNVIVLDEFTTGGINGLNLDSDIVLSDVPILKNFSFIGDVIVHGNIRQTNGKKLNSLDISKLGEQVVKVGDGRPITGLKIFKSPIRALNGIEIGSLNGVAFPNDLVLLESTEPQTIFATKFFKKAVSVGTLETAANVIVARKVNGLDLRLLNKTTAYNDKPVVILGSVLFNNTISASDVAVHRKMNEVNVTDLLNNVIYLTDGQVIKFPVHIYGGNIVVDGSSEIYNVNGVILVDYLPRIVLSNSEAPNYRINGTKAFITLKIEEDLKCDTINDVDLHQLSATAFSRTKPQNVAGKFTTDQMDIDGNLVAKAINGVQFDDFVLIDDPAFCAIDSNVEFLHDVILLSTMTVGLLNGYPADVTLDNEHQVMKFGREFAEIVVSENLNWLHSRDDQPGISSLFENAMTLQTDQVITSPIILAGGFYAENVHSIPWIDATDLEEYLLDAVDLTPGEQLKLSGKNTFQQGLIFNASTTITKLKVQHINTINVEYLDHLIVKASSSGIIYGTKIFADGVDIKELYFKDFSGKGDYDELITREDPRVIQHAEFHDLNVLGDLKFNRSRGFDLNKLLKERVSRKGEQLLFGNYTISALIIENVCNISSINGIKMDDILFKDSVENQSLNGKKTFNNGVAVDGRLEAPHINDLNFKELNRDTYRTNANEKIKRPVEFIRPVILSNSLTVNESINGYQLKEVSSKLLETVKDIETRAQHVAADLPSNERLSQIIEMKERLPKSPVWLEHLRLIQDWTALGPQTRVEVTQTEYGAVVGLHYSNDTESWRNGCQCNSVRFVTVEGPKISIEESNFECKNAFIVSSQRRNIYNVHDHSISFNKSCTVTGVTSLIVADGKDNMRAPLLEDTSKGFLSDVKAFSANEIDYLILSYFFDAKKQSHDSFTYVYRVDNHGLTLIQSIHSSGPVRLAMSSLRDDWFLAIANNRNPKNDSCIANSAIYRWSSPHKGSPGQFVLLREIRTNGATDVIFAELEDLSVEIEGSTINFVAFAQKGGSVDGEVIVLQYDDSGRNYNFFQSIRSSWSVTGLEYLCIQDNCYLLIVVPQEGIHFYEYRFIEGFLQAFTVPIIGARDIGIFSWGQDYERLLFPIASTKTCLLAEGVVAGISYEKGDSIDPYENIPVTV